MLVTTLKKTWLCGFSYAVLALAPVTSCGENIFVVKSQNSPPIAQALEGFRASCREPVVEIELRGKSNQKELLKALGEAKPDVVVAIGLQAAETSRDYVGNIPLLFVMVANPNKRGLEGSNIAGISLNIPLIMQFTNYTNVVRNLRKLGVIYDEKKTGDVIREAKIEAEKIGMELVGISVNSPKAVADALKKLIEQKIDALWMVADETVVTPASFQFLQRETARNKLPFLAASEIFVEKGALASLTVDYTDMGRQAGEIVNQMIKDRKLFAELRTVPPAKVKLAINLETVRLLGGVVNADAVKTASKIYQ
ncbi:MAG: ABC transporter substrate binding protein [Verrucomicrobiota bacterium]